MTSNVENLKALAASLPRDVQANAVALVEKMTSVIEGLGDDPERARWRPTNVKLVQATTDRSKLPKGASIGSLVLGDSVVSQPLDVIPMGVWNGRQFWSPDQNEAKLICSSPDAKVGYLGYDCKTCPHSRWNEETRRSECGMTYEFMVIKADLSDVFKISFSKTNYAIGKEWFGKIKDSGKQLYSRKYGVSTKTNAKYKQVESFNIEYYNEASQRDVPEEHKAFVYEIFKGINSDRKEMLDVFHKNIMDKRARGDIAPVLLSDNASATPAITVSVEGVVSDSAKKYSV